MSGKYVYLFFCMIFLLQFTCGYSNQFEELPSKRIVIEQVIAEEDAVLIWLDGSWRKVEVLQVTPNGILVRENGVWLSLMDNYYTWTCRICGTVNPQGKSVCSNIRNHPK